MINFPNNLIFDLWKEQYGEDDPEVRAPLFYPKIKKGGLLFVGCNPSFSERAFNNFLEDSDYEDIDPDLFLNFSNVDENKIEDIINIEKLSQDNYDLYFGRFKKISKYTGLDWQHIDLFFERETSQNRIKEKYFNRGEMIDFAKKQFNLSLKVIKYAGPEVMIVANALASKILKKSLGNNLRFDKSIGTYILKLDNLEFPVFLSGMLSGRRALDNHSFKRLCWHINNLIGN